MAESKSLRDCEDRHFQHNVTTGFELNSPCHAGLIDGLIATDCSRPDKIKVSVKAPDMQVECHGVGIAYTANDACFESGVDVVMRSATVRQTVSPGPQTNVQTTGIALKIAPTALLELRLTLSVFRCGIFLVQNKQCYRKLRIMLHCLQRRYGTCFACFHLNRK